MTKVLIVDSDERVAAGLCAMLAGEADDTRWAANPTAARQALRQGACDILIVALGTTLEQVQERLTLCARVKSRTPTTTVILMATDSALETVLQALGDGIGDHIASGDSAATQVRALVRRLVRRQAQRQAKIVCTIGPASDSQDSLSRLIDAGMDVARLNFSHGDWDWHRAVCERIRRLADHVAIMADLQGPKLRIGHMAHDAVVPLRRGATFTLTSRPVSGSETVVSLDYPDLPRDVATGDTLYLDDGLIELRVLEVRDGTDIVCQVQTGGRLSSRKGIHAPRAILGMHVPTAKDREDIELAAELDVDFLAVSFVAEADDVRQVRAAVQQAGAEMPLISKIEREIALENFNRILEVSDGIMVARGDLAVNIPAEDVPRHQKAMIRACNQQGKPVICATQMLESMCAYPLPTRAEVSDVFNAVLDGADAVMLSAESAAGDYPIEAVGMMARIVRSAERTLPQFNPAAESVLPDQTPAIISHGISTMIERFNRHSGHITAILAVTRSGHTARMLARYRPGVPIIAATSSRRAARQFLLSRGITPMRLDDDLPDPTVAHAAITQAVQERLLSEDDTVLAVSGSGWAPRFHTNILGLFAVRDILDSHC